VLLYLALIAGCLGSLFIAWQSATPRNWVTYLSLVFVLLGAAGTIWVTSDSDKSTKVIIDKSNKISELSLNLYSLTMKLSQTQNELKNKAVAQADIQQILRSKSDEIADLNRKIADSQIKLGQQNEKLSLQNKATVDSVTGGDYNGSLEVMVIGQENLVEISYINEGKFTLYDAILEIEDLDITNEILQPVFDKFTTSKSQIPMMTASYNAKAKATSLIDIGNLAPGRGQRTVLSLPETASRHYVIYARARNGQTTLSLTMKRVGRTWKSTWTEYKNGKITRQGGTGRSVRSGHCPTGSETLIVGFKSVIDSNSR